MKTSRKFKRKKFLDWGKKEKEILGQQQSNSATKETPLFEL
jgi:hypothetical protein